MVNPKNNRCLPLSEFLDYVRRYEMPPLPPETASPWGHAMQGDLDSWNARNECTRRGMWAIVDKVWTQALAEWIGKRKCLEVMAGAGWLAKALADFGVGIVATDNAEWDSRHDMMLRLCPVEKVEAVEAIVAHPETEVLIISWPPYEDEAVTRACEAWGEGRPIVYIGEKGGGCNAPDSFWRHFVKDSGAPHIPLMAWPGIHDGVSIGSWNKTGKDEPENEED
jgi:hypothetical protein